MEEKKSIKVDDADKVIINSLLKKNMTIPDIAKKLDVSEEIIKAFLEGFESKANERFRSKKYPEASFYHFQHKTHNLNGECYAKFDVTLRRCGDEWRGFDEFLITADKKGDIKVSTKWEEVLDLWNKYKETMLIPECLVGNKYFSVEDEEHLMDAVCKIKFNDDSEPGSGCLLKIECVVGILTSSKVLPTPRHCESAEATFEKLDGNTVNIKFKPKEFFFSDPKICYTFVACDDLNARKCGIVPLENFGDVSVGKTITTYFHLRGKQKVQMQKNITKAESHSIYYDGNFGRGSCGCPTYSKDKIIGLNLQKSATNQGAINIHSIAKWVKEKLAQSETIFTHGEEVKAMWTDNFWYLAKIEGKTEIGYQVIYSGFNEYADLTIDKIKKKAATVTTTTVTTTTVTTTTVTTTTVTTVTTTTTIDQDDQEMIFALLEKKTPIEIISKKLNLSSAVIKQLVNSEKNDSIPKESVYTEKMEKVHQWLKGLGLEAYTKQFEEHNYDDMSGIIILKPKEVDEMFKKVECKDGACVKIQNSLLKAKKAYNMEIGNNISVENDVMPKGWTPQKNQLGHKDYTPEFKKKDGTCSIRGMCNRIKHRQAPDKAYPNNSPAEFYVKSTRFNQYFKIVVKWN